VDLTVKVHAEVAIHFVGSPIGVKEGGILVPARNDVTVEALRPRSRRPSSSTSRNSESTTLSTSATCPRSRG
jgi:hypothetical protein